MSRAGKQQAQTAKRGAESDKRHWQGKLNSAKDATSRATFQRGVDRAQRNIDNAQRQIDRHS